MPLFKSQKDFDAAVEERTLALEQQIKNLQTRLSNIESSTFKQPCSVDFHFMRAFSVERVMYQDVPTTVVGYFNENEVKQWFLYISEEEHQRLTKSFDEYMQKCGR